jgi:D-glycero-D-manno-heptose 1,7-bisphosphate phosphatase
VNVLGNVRHVVLDRDGVLNREAATGTFVRRPDEFVWLQHALDALALLSAAGIHLSVATNQSGVGRGVMSMDDVSAVHQKMRADARARGVALDDVFVCTHAPDAGCACRKPAPALLVEAIMRAGIERGATLMVGDDQRDLDAATAAGIAAVLVRTGKGMQTEARLSPGSVPVFDDLLAVAHALAPATGVRVA